MLAIRCHYARFLFLFDSRLQVVSRRVDRSRSTGTGCASAGDPGPLGGPAHITQTTNTTPAGTEAAGSTAATTVGDVASTESDPDASLQSSRGEPPRSRVCLRGRPAVMWVRELIEHPSFTTRNTSKSSFNQ